MPAAPTPKLKSHPDAGLVVVNTRTQLTGIPPGAWRYRLGNRAAIDWVLDQHKEKTIRDPTVRARFDTYRFADHKEAMIALLAKVVRVSLETVAVTDAMRLTRSAAPAGAFPRHQPPFPLTRFPNPTLPKPSRLRYRARSNDHRWTCVGGPRARSDH